MKKTNFLFLQLIALFGLFIFFGERLMAFDKADFNGSLAPTITIGGYFSYLCSPERMEDDDQAYDMERMGNEIIQTTSQLDEGQLCISYSLAFGIDDAVPMLGLTDLEKETYWNWMATISTAVSEAKNSPLMMFLGEKPGAKFSGDSSGKKSEDLKTSHYRDGTETDNNNSSLIPRSSSPARIAEGKEENDSSNSKVVALNVQSRVATPFATSQLTKQQEKVVETLRNIAMRDFNQIGSHYQEVTANLKQKARNFIRKYQLEDMVPLAKERLKELEERRKTSNAHDNDNKSSLLDYINLHIDLGIPGFVSLGVELEGKAIKDGFNSMANYFHALNEEQARTQLQNYEQELSHIRSSGWLELKEKIEAAESAARVREQELAFELGGKMLEMSPDFLKQQGYSSRRKEKIDDEKKNNQEWFENQIQEAWKARILASEEYFKDLKDERHSDRENLKSLKQKYEQTYKRWEEAKRELAVVTDVHDTASENEEKTRTRRDSIKREYDVKIHRIEKATDEARETGGNPEAIREAGEKDLQESGLKLQLEEANQALKQAATEVKEALKQKKKWNQEVEQTETDKFRMDEQYQLEKRIVLKNINQAEHYYNVDMEVGKNVFRIVGLPEPIPFTEKEDL